MGQKVILISNDAFTTDDLKELEKCPNFRKYLSGGASAGAMRSIYPTTTYPAHAAISTGCFPDATGLYANCAYRPGRTEPGVWNWAHTAVHTDDIFAAAKRKGLTTAAVFWPSTGSHPDVDYLINECWADSPERSFWETLRQNGSSEEVIALAKSVGHPYVYRKHPKVDYWLVDCAARLFEKYAPDLLVLHPADTDTYRHEHGMSEAYTRRAVLEADDFIGTLGAAIEASGHARETNLILISDHGQIDIDKVTALNAALAEGGFIDREGGRCAGWRAWAHSAGMSAYVYLADRKDAELGRKVFRYLRTMRDCGKYGLGEVFTEAETRERYRLGGDFSFVVETDGRTAFGDELFGPTVRTVGPSASHGYLPEKGPQPVFVAKGSAFRQGARIDSCHVTDVAPTLAAVLDVELTCAGRPLTELLNL